MVRMATNQKRIDRWVHYHKREVNKVFDDDRKIEYTEDDDWEIVPDSNKGIITVTPKHLNPMKVRKR